MGSLMGGWDSPVRDPKSVKMMRNKSLTKQGIDEFWKSKKKTEADHLQAVSSPDEVSRATSLPLVDTKDGHFILGKEVDVHLDKLMDNWWTRSNWAFLNEEPVISSEVPKSKYASQYHLSSSKPDTRISGV